MCTNAPKVWLLKLVSFAEEGARGGAGVRGERRGEGGRVCGREEKKERRRRRRCSKEKEMRKKTKR